MAKKEEEYYWECDYCHKEFDTAEEGIEHEKICKKDPKNNSISITLKVDKKSILIWCFVALGIYFFTFMVVNSYAEANKLPQRQITDPLNWFHGKPTPTPTPTSIPTPTMIPTPITVPTITPRPKIYCSVNAYCKGQEFTLKSGKCSDYTCCQIGNQYIVATVSDCNAAQSAINSFVPNVPLPTSKPYTYPTVISLPTFKQYEKIVVPTFSPLQIPNSGDYTISIDQCKSNCITTTDSELLVIRNGCRANGSLSSSDCMNILNSRDYFVSQCQSKCK